MADNSAKFEPRGIGRILTAVSNNLHWIETPQGSFDNDSVAGGGAFGRGNDIRKPNQFTNNGRFANHTL